MDVCVQLLSRVQLCNPINCSLPGSSVRGIFQARKLEGVAISFSGRSSQPSDRSRVSCISWQILHCCVTQMAEWAEGTAGCWLTALPGHCPELMTGFPPAARWTDGHEQTDQKAKEWWRFPFSSSPSMTPLGHVPALLAKWHPHLKPWRPSVIR